MSKKIIDSDWKDWLAQRKERQRTTYLNRASRLKSDYNREETQAKAYSGRVLLELIQNANDAGLDYSNSVDIYLELTEDHLLIANTGEPFSKKGVESLLISDNSPKQFRNDCIGYKGLGFRSLLNWTSSVIILSGGLSVGFDDRFADNFLDNLRDESEDIDELVREFEANGISSPIATLSVPRWLDNEALGEWDSDLTAVYERGQQLQEQGYDTVICVALDDTENQAETQREINDLSKDLLLFLQHTRSLELKSPNRTERWKVDRATDSVTIQPKGGSSTTWHIIEERDKVPEKYLDSDDSEGKYEIKVAIPEAGALQSAMSQNLFVFFPTEVSFPFPLLAHATFEVEDNRKQLRETDTNRFVAEQLASMMSQAAAELNNRREDPWLAFSALSPDGTIGTSINKLGPKGEDKTFEDLLQETLSETAIVPVHGGGYRRPQDISRINGDFNDLLQYEVFDDVSQYPSQKRLRQQLKGVGVEPLAYDDLRTKLNEIAPRLSMDDRAEIIYRLVTNDLIEEQPTPELLIDSEEDPIQSDTIVFLPPQDEQIPLPGWISQDFLNSELTTKLKERFDVSTNRDLKKAIRPFDLNEYDLGRLIQSIVAEANQRVSNNPDEELRWRQKMVQVIWELKSSREDQISLPDELTIPLPTRTGGSEAADALYIGAEYPNGKLLEELYQPVDQGSFVVRPDELKLPGDDSEIESFLCWLGVADEPRQIKIKNPGSDFRDYVLSELEYPLKFGGLRFESKDEVPSANRRHRLEKITTIDRLEEVLENADPHSIIALLTTISEDLETWRRKGDNGATYRVKPPRKQKWRRLYSQSIPSYPLWLIQTTAWLPVDAGNTRPPMTCSFTQEAKSLSTVIGFPAINSDYYLFEDLNTDQKSVSITLQKAGVANTLADLSWESFYRILLKLPEFDPDHQEVKRLYSKILSKKGSPSGEAYAEFQENGTMLGELDGEVRYFSIDDLWFPESKALPKSILESHRTVPLETDESGTKVEERFGVQPLSVEEIHLKSHNFERHKYASEFKGQVERLKKFIFALRMDTTRASQDRRTIKKLDVVLCNSFVATAKVGSKDITIELDPGTFLIWESTGYLVPESIDFKKTPLRNDDVAGLVGEIFSSVLELEEISTDIYTLATATDRKKTFSIITNKSSEKVEVAQSRLDVKEPEEPEFGTPEIQQEPSGPHRSKTRPQETTSTTQSQTESSVQRRPSVNREGTKIETQQKNLETIDRRNISIRRLSSTPKTPTSRDRRRIADGNRAEDVCVKFEESEGRFPIKVAHIQGSESYRCDIISFKNADRRDEFKEEFDATLIDRYIEVKARTTEKDSITLKGNELAAAQDHQEKYFLYRAYEDTSDRSAYEVVVLNDPTGHEEAVERKIEVNPYYTKESNCFELTIQTDDEGDSSDGNN